MVNQITLTGMILTAAPIGEYDRRVVILTRERGKISAFARGARRPNSALMGVTSPFSFGEFTVYEGRTSYTLVSASISNYFQELRTDVEGAYYGFYFMDLAGYYAREANDETEMLKLLYQTLRALTNVHIPNELIRCIYELKTITVNGEGPQVMECIMCGDREREKVFSIRRGGVICTQCAGHISDGIRLLPSTLYTLQYIVCSPVEKLYTFVVKEDVLKELKKLTNKDIQVNIFEVKKPDLDAQVVGKTIARQIEGKMAYRRVIKMAIQNTMRAGAEGIKVHIAGRLNGAEMARQEMYKEGRTPLHTFRADIDYCQTTALTKVGLLGIKVWICRGEVYHKVDLAPNYAQQKENGRQGGDRRRGFGKRRNNNR